MKYYIWSIEHNMWWRENWNGYTANVSEAGQYDEVEAQHIVKRANIVSFNECMIPVSAVEVKE